MCTTMPVIGSPNVHARNHRVLRSFRATPRKIAHLMIRCRTGDPLLFRMTRNSRLMLSIRLPLSVGGSKAYTLPRVGRRFRQPLVYQYLVHVLPMLVYYLADEPPAGGPPRHGRAPPPPYSRLLRLDRGCAPCRRTSPSRRSRLLFVKRRCAKAPENPPRGS